MSYTPITFNQLIEQSTVTYIANTADPATITGYSVGIVRKLEAFFIEHLLGDRTPIWSIANSSPYGVGVLLDFMLAGPSTLAERRRLLRIFESEVLTLLLGRAKTDMITLTTLGHNSVSVQSKPVTFNYNSIPYTITADGL